MCSLAAGGGIVAAVVLSGCSGQGTDSFESRLVDSASGDTSADAFALPKDVQAGQTWEKVSMLCPYDKVSDRLPDELGKAAKGIDTAAAEDTQWLLFSVDGKAQKLSLDRTKVDFCSADSPSGVFTPKDRWRAQKQDGVWELSPVTE